MRNATASQTIDLEAEARAQEAEQERRLGPDPLRERPSWVDEPHQPLRPSVYRATSASDDLFGDDPYGESDDHHFFVQRANDERSHR